MANETVDYEAALGETATVGWVVHEVIVPAKATMWAWCRVEMDEPGYSEIHFTKTDGKTSAERPAGDLKLGPVVFQAWC